MKIYYIRPIKPTLYEKALNEVYSTKNKTAIRMMCTACCLLINYSYAFANEVVAPSASPTPTPEEKPVNPVKQLGYDAIDTVQFGLTIIAIVMALFESGKAMIEGDPKRIPSIFAKYGIGVICVYAIPYVYFRIKNAFSGWGY